MPAREGARPPRIRVLQVSTPQGPAGTLVKDGTHVFLAGSRDWPSRRALGEFGRRHCQGDEPGVFAPVIASPRLASPRR